MNRILLIVCLSVMAGCNTKKKSEKDSSLSNSDATVKENRHKNGSQEKEENSKLEIEVNRTISLQKEFKNFEIHTVEDTIKADLNGDQILDLAFFINNDDKRELFIRDGKSKKEIKIGQDLSFKSIDGDFNWIDYWGTTNDKETFEVLIKDSEIVGDTTIKLVNTSIFVRKEEVGGGVITFKNQRFIWIHQSD